MWIPMQFNDYGTPVVPVRKLYSQASKRPNFGCVVISYSVMVNAQLETHRHPMPRPDDLIRKLGGGYYFTKIDLSNAYSLIKLAPESQKRLALALTEVSCYKLSATLNKFSARLFPINNGKADQ